MILVSCQRRGGLPGQMRKTERAQAEMQAAFLEDGFLICDSFASVQECADMVSQANELIALFDETMHQVVFSASGQSHAASDYFMDSASQISCFLEAELLMKQVVLSSQRQML